MILHGLICQYPALRTLHGRSLLSASNALVSYCQQTWASAKMIRITFQLNRMIQQTLGRYPERAKGESIAPEHNIRRDHGTADDMASNHTVAQIQQQPCQSSDRQQRPPNREPPSPISMASGVLRGGPPALGNAGDGDARNVAFSWGMPQQMPDSNTTMTHLSSEIPMPDWAAIDFDFEHAGVMNRDEMSTGYYGAELFNLNDSWSQSFSM